MKYYLYAKYAKKLTSLRKKEKKLEEIKEYKKSQKEQLEEIKRYKEEQLDYAYNFILKAIDEGKECCECYFFNFPHFVTHARDAKKLFVEPLIEFLVDHGYKVKNNFHNITPSITVSWSDSEEGD